ncbi:AMP dependent coa ligase [Operophtera brumata]|uniref:AMP dependent coa ligase n=1 Tax=Operophtera brumata TaxID=104452 RepID=A0A0L7KP60_OPEBR|nr:AMP dependent coa ligase [Operophtera brumata]
MIQDKVVTNGVSLEVPAHITVNIAVGLKDLGVKPGDVVGVCGDSRSEYIAVAMGAVCCGATATFFNALFTQEEMIHVLNISRPCIIFCTTSALKAHLSTFEGTESIQHIVQVDGDPTASGVLALSSVETKSDARCYEAEEVRDGKDTAMIFYSSGTTGLPKGVMLSHINILYIFASYQ